MRTIIYICIISLLTGGADVTRAQIPFRVMSYNVENLFDTQDDPKKNDNEFLPDGNHYWSPKRYWHKQRQLARVILAAGEWDTPALVALCEVENDSVLCHLTQRTPLRSQGYRYCLTDGSDPRGINSALLYQPDKFKLLARRSVPLRFTRRRHKQSRDILHVTGLLASGDTLDVFVCHFPSRYGGEKESEQDRFDAVATLRHMEDSLTCVRRTPLLLALGDFNDTPVDPSLTRHMKGSTFRNLFARLPRQAVRGTHKYQGRWAQLDQLFFNRPAGDTGSSFRLVEGTPRIFAPPFLLTTDKSWRGVRPFRTYYGFRYEGGFSDHLPILVDFEVWNGTNRGKE